MDLGAACPLPRHRPGCRRRRRASPRRDRTRIGCGLGGGNPFAHLPIRWLTHREAHPAMPAAFADCGSSVVVSVVEWVTRQSRSDPQTWAAPRELSDERTRLGAVNDCPVRCAVVAAVLLGGDGARWI